MLKLKSLKNYFSIKEIIIWLSSCLLIIFSFLIFDRENYLSLIASLVGVTALIFNAKGNPFGQFLMIIFSLLYGIISLTFAYYGEMLTYWGMTLPMSVFSFISWIKNPFSKDKAEVKINYMSLAEIIFMWISAIVVTVIFYFILSSLNTSNIVPSTISVTTSYLAVYLSFKRSSYFPLAYASNDVILIILWILASIEYIKYISVVICFIAFFINDLYCFICWENMKKNQAEHSKDC